MALAIKLDGQRTASYAELARLGYVSRSRLSQILKLRLLAPDIQERLLFLEPVARGRETRGGCWDGTVGVGRGAVAVRV